MQATLPMVIDDDDDDAPLEAAEALAKIDYRRLSRELVQLGFQRAPFTASAVLWTHSKPTNGAVVNARSGVLSLKCGGIQFNSLNPHGLSTCGKVALTLFGGKTSFPVGDDVHTVHIGNPHQFQNFTLENAYTFSLRQLKTLEQQIASGTLPAPYFITFWRPRCMTEALLEIVMHAIELAGEGAVVVAIGDQFPALPPYGYNLARLDVLGQIEAKPSGAHTSVDFSVEVTVKIPHYRLLRTKVCARGDMHESTQVVATTEPPALWWSRGPCVSMNTITVTKPPTEAKPADEKSDKQGACGTSESGSEADSESEATTVSVGTLCATDDAETQSRIAECIGNFINEFELGGRNVALSANSVE